MKKTVTTLYSLQDCYYREVWTGIGRGSRLTVEKWMTVKVPNGRSYRCGVICDRLANRRDRVERIIYAIESTGARVGSWLHHVARSLYFKVPGAINRYRDGVALKADYWPSAEERVAFNKYWHWNSRVDLLYKKEKP